jgi:PAS domain S-box-containing protein
MEISHLYNGKGDNIGSIGICRDITERRKAEKEIRESSDFLENIFKTTADGIIVTDNEGFITKVNDATEEITGYPRAELLKQHITIFTPTDKEHYSEGEKEIEKLVQEGMIKERESLLKRKDGQCIIIETNMSLLFDKKGQQIGCVGINSDITERKKMEQQLLQSEKLKSLGELSGGVAHDFNNVLAAILGRVQLLKMQLKPPIGKEEKRKTVLELEKGLEIIERASLDGAETVRRIQEFSRRRTDEKSFEQIDINELVENALEFTKVKWKNDAESKGIKIKVKKELSPISPILGSSSEIREVFTNLINNAIDAMPQGGTIRIESFMDDTIAVISISDTGNGIPKHIEARIYDPFFTTKDVKSTGLGLSVSYGIINRHKGTITADSVEGEGTTFTVKFPITKKKAEGNITKENVIPLEKKQQKASILVIDDEEDIRKLLKDILTNAGHKVEIAADGNEGIEIFKKKKFDLVLTDLGMPVMSGWEVAEKVKSINEKVPVALITGWNVKSDGSEMNDSGVNLVIHKPFKMEEVLNLVQEGMLLRDQLKAV